MKKHGVVLDKPDKTAMAGVTCPICGQQCQEMSPGSGQWACPNHGTEGFEKNKDEGES